jgi:hypothetical protein
LEGLERRQWPGRREQVGKDWYSYICGVQMGMLVYVLLFFPDLISQKTKGSFESSLRHN